MTAVVCTRSSQQTYQVRLHSITGDAYSAAGQAGSVLHTMAVFQVFLAKLLRALNESGTNPDVFKELCTATGQTLHTTKATAQVIGKAMASLVVLELHLWLNLTGHR